MLGFKHAVAELAQDRDAVGPDVRVVFDHKDHLLPVAAWRVPRADFFAHGRWATIPREVKFDARSGRRFAVDGDVSA